ncbi:MULTISPECIES: YqaJ viral recombinase family protein [unclassified Sphingomonas]|uniref:YqaJ viral recombinase family protein n=1 Tax=unclassified Sphingomonas TaxID=196159 RepID=UPI0006F77643|nr:MULTISPECIES: YqaJ viral recombinase family protein [unclassified Sphingomonas]KQM62402.1 hypothetical protein ASE65_05295 [Sphingomonas sp. Leaf16]KQN13805.1 hypothetical protein ASE81_05365 [Sphingomonas sp. Leaf29]KQN22966.1 hypothetical protein ASE83_00045 [Sphingomonas sp. Leaf32]
MIRYHDAFEQGSIEWLNARCGLLSASEMKHVLSVQGGGSVAMYRATGAVPEKLTAKKSQALDAIGNRCGSVAELCFLADVSDGVIRGLIKDGAIEKYLVEQPMRFSTPNDDRAVAHLYELLAQRISRYVEPHYIGDDMLRGHEDEIRARIAYEKMTGRTVREVGLITNDEWGFTLAYSPDGVVGDDGLIEAKSRRQKYQVQTLVECVPSGSIPAEYLAQCQTGLLVSKRPWLDFLSYAGGYHMPAITVHPDPVVQNAIVEASGAFEERLAARLAQYLDVINSDARLVPTERVIEQEMFV